MKTIHLSDKWAREIHHPDHQYDSISPLTFCGALEEEYWEIAHNWNVDTQKKNERTYENIILPALKNHNDKSISDYTLDDYDEALQSIKEKGYLTAQGIKRTYSESTIKAFQNLIYYVVFYAAHAGYCENVLWGTRLQLEVRTVEDEVIERTKLKKSLTINQEKRFTINLLEDKNLTGERIGLLLMLGCGVRNAEACGLNYGDFRFLDHHEDIYVLWIYKTTKPGTSDLQAGGKTWNTGRIIPVPDKIVDILMARKEQVKDILRSLQRDEKEVDTMPIVNKGYLSVDSFDQRAGGYDLSMAAHPLFSEAGIEPEELAYIDRELNEEGQSEVVNEKDATAYLLRRNFATHLHIEGLTIAEIQYIMGHDVEDAYESRAEFVDSDRIYQIALKMQKRPILNNCPLDTSGKRINNILCKEGIRAIIQSYEPFQPLRIDLRTVNGKFDGAVLINSISSEYKRNIDISAQYRDAYGDDERR